MAAAPGSAAPPPAARRPPTAPKPLPADRPQPTAPRPLAWKRTSEPSTPARRTNWRGASRTCPVTSPATRCTGWGGPGPDSPTFSWAPRGRWRCSRRSNWTFSRSRRCALSACAGSPGRPRRWRRCRRSWRWSRRRWSCSTRRSSGWPRACRVSERSSGSWARTAAARRATSWWSSSPATTRTASPRLWRPSSRRWRAWRRGSRARNPRASKRGSGRCARRGSTSPCPSPRFANRSPSSRTARSRWNVCRSGIAA